MGGELERGWNMRSDKQKTEERATKKRMNENGDPFICGIQTPESGVGDRLTTTYRDDSQAASRWTTDRTPHDHPPANLIFRTSAAFPRSLPPRSKMFGHEVDLVDGPAEAMTARFRILLPRRPHPCKGSKKERWWIEDIQSKCRTEKKVPSSLWFPPPSSMSQRKPTTFFLNSALRERERERRWKTLFFACDDAERAIQPHFVKIISAKNDAAQANSATLT